MVAQCASTDETVELHIANRRPHIGSSEVAAWARSLAPGSKVLDLGCGHGVPITKLLTESGFDVFAIDSSEKMIARLRESLPSVTAEHATIQESHFFNTVFDAIVAWGVLFHLTEPDQEAVIAKVARHLTAGGRFLFTSGDDRIADEVTRDGFTFPCVSLGRDGYASVLGKHGLTFVECFSDRWENTYYLSEMTGGFKTSIAGPVVGLPHPTAPQRGCRVGDPASSALKARVREKRLRGGRGGPDRRHPLR